MAITRREWLGLTAAGVAAAATGALVGPILLQKRSGAADLIGAVFGDVDGRRRSLAEWRGQVLLCNFWASWCEPCREEMPMLSALRTRHASRGFEILGIAIDTAANVGLFSKKVAISYPVLLAGFETVELMRKLGNRSGGLPFTVLLDRSGVITYSKLGALQERELLPQLTAIL